MMKRFPITPALVFALLLIVTSGLLTGCEDEDAGTLERFETDWHAAVNAREPEKLFDLLDARSRRHIESKLEELRGLEPEMHTFIINQLGGERVKTLHELSAAKYFGLWWKRVTDEQLPTMRIEASGDTAAYMVLNLNDKSQRIELVSEAGRWRWVLPKQKFDQPKLVQPASAN